MAVSSVLDAELAWVSEFDKGACKILAHRFPGVPNHGNITKIDWAAVEPVDIITGGSPCQDLSHAGARKGMTEGTRSNLWVAMREAIAQLRPKLVVWENVRGAYSAGADSALEHDARLLAGTRRRDGEPVLRALGRVLGDLSDLGYDAGWHGLRASDVGSCHPRFRVFLVAYPNGEGRSGLGRLESVRRDADRRRGANGLRAASESEALLPSPRTSDTNGAGQHGDGGLEPLIGGIVKDNLWGQYAAAIHRWEQLTRPAPAPTETGPKGNPRLSAAFSEWMMGLPAGWVTDVPGITRNEALKALGNGVVPQQAAAALRFLLGMSEVAA